MKKLIKFKLKTKTNFFVKAAVLTFICFCLVAIINLQLQYNELVDQKTEIEAEIENYNNTIEELSDQIARPFDDEYIKSVAREKLNYRMPNEIIFYNELLK